MDGGEDHHRIVIVNAILLTCELTRVNVRDLFVHVEEVAITLTNHVDAETVDSLREIKEYGKTGVVHTETSIATLFCRA